MAFAQGCEEGINYFDNCKRNVNCKLLLSTKGLRLYQCSRKPTNQTETNLRVSKIAKGRKGVLGYDSPAKISLVKKTGKTLYALIRWNARPDKYVPRPSFYPTQALRKYPTLVNMLFNYYESIIS